MHWQNLELGEKRKVADEVFLPVATASLGEMDLIAGCPGKSLQPIMPPAAQSGRHQNGVSTPDWDPGRAFDIIVSLLLIVLLLPVMALIALATFLSDGSSPIFRHVRVGKNGKAFPCLKFRTMRANSDNDIARLLEVIPNLKTEWENGYKLKRDPRVTRLGQFLRVTSLDELPQLFNVLKGEMALVGPRPIVAAEMTRYGRYIDHYLSVRPGLTGLWQVSGRSATTYRRRVAADVLYVRSRSFWLDLKILFNTIPAVLAGNGSC